MKLNENAQLFVPFAANLDAAVKRTRRMVVAAHQDDVEIMAQHGTLSCFDATEEGFAAVVCADGRGSPRSGIYAACSDDEMAAIRIREQQKAATVGEYTFLAQLGFPSALIKNGDERALVEDLKTLLLAAKPGVVYTHNPADKHDTHAATMLRTLRALRELAPEYRPEKFYGCEVWRALDWLNDDEKVILDVSVHPALRAALLGVFDSQIEGGKRYDLAALGRQYANATFLASHDTDEMDAAMYAMDLSPLIDGGDVFSYVKEQIDRFAADVKGRLERLQ